MARRFGLVAFWLALAIIPCVNPARAAEPGSILWKFIVPQPVWPGHRPAIGANGSLYWDSGAGLFAISSTGEQVWWRNVGNGNPVGIGQHGEIYAADAVNGVIAYTPMGNELWRFTDTGYITSFLGGPSVGPDGNIYACTDDVTGIGVFSLTPQGMLRWNVPGFKNTSGGAATEMAFGSGHVYKAEEWAPTQGPSYAGVAAIHMQDGALLWTADISGGGRQVRVNPLTEDVHVPYMLSSVVLAFTSIGALDWQFKLPPAWASDLYGMAVGPDGTVYGATEYRNVVAIHANGTLKWNATDVLPPMFPNWPEVSPDGSVLVYTTTAGFGGAYPGSVVALDTRNGAVRFAIELPPARGRVPTPWGQPQFSNDGSVVYVMAGAFTQFDEEYLYAIQVGSPAAIVTMRALR